MEGGCSSCPRAIFHAAAMRAGIFSSGQGRTIEGRLRKAGSRSPISRQGITVIIFVRKDQEVIKGKRIIVRQEIVMERGGKTRGKIQMEGRRKEERC